MACWAWREATHCCGRSALYWVEIGRYNTLRCPYDGYVFTAYIYW